MKIADLRHQIILQEKVQTPDGMGGHTEAWSTKYETWAAIWPVSAKETRENMRVEANVSHNIRIRFRPGVTSSMIIIFGTRTFEIKGIVNVGERNIRLDMVCNERF